MMKGFSVQSATEQVAARLRQELLSGTWAGLMPGENRLMARLGIGRKTVREAINLLEREGWLEYRGVGRQRAITLPGNRPAITLRVGILLYEREDRYDRDNATLLAELQEAGFIASFAPRTVTDLKGKISGLARMVEQHPADAWIIASGSREINEWFSKQDVPAMAMFGRIGVMRIAAAHPVMIPALRQAVRKLVELGHRRITMITREERRLPVPSRPEQAFLDELETAGIQTGKFNLPDWKETREGLKDALDKLFQVTPPTALIFQETELFTAARIYLAGRGINAPRDVSLITGDPDASIEWSTPTISHIAWNKDAVVRRVINWAKHVSKGKEDHRQVGTLAKFIEGGTIGTAPRIG